MKKLFTSGTLWSCFIAVAMMMASQSVRAEYFNLTAVDGMLSYGQSGLGNETYDKLVDANIETKWGGWFDNSLSDEDSWPVNTDNSANKMWVIVKAAKAIVPDHYFLVTGNDTGNGDHPGERNWSSWKIYGGNFESDDQAVREGEGWTLIDNRENEPLPAKNFAPVNLDFSEAPTTAYQYYWIEILESVAGADVYLQMAEWGLGTYGEFEKFLKDLADAGTALDEPLNYFFQSAAPNGFGGEGASNLLDGDSGTKWCCSFTNRNEGETTNGGYIIFKASRNIAPTYYTLTTANDSGNNFGRNWKQWQIYGATQQLDRNSDEWVLIDKKSGVPTGNGLNELPAANYTQAYFTLSEGNTTEFRYFKIELDQVVSSGLMQMADISLGDVNVVILDRNAVAEAAEAKYDADLITDKALLDQMAALIAQVKACTDPIELSELSAAIDQLFLDINAAANNYKELTVVRNQAILAIDAGNLTAEAVAYLTGWMNDTDAVAPNNEYPCGNYAYIFANRLLTGAEALAEARRINAYIFNGVTEQPDPIYASYEFICGTEDNWNANEGPEMLIDGKSGINGTESTKWGTGTSKDRYIVFKTDEPIQPTYYGLVTGNDTNTYKDRNWKNWKIWGANFDEEPDRDAEDFDPLAVKNSDKWELIDVKENVGTDILKTTNLFESYIYLSIGCAKPYQYFKIEVYHSGGMQMNEFTFYNNGNMIEYRDSYVEEFEDYDPRELPAYGEYITSYENKYEELKTTVNAPDVMKFKNELVDIQNDINASRKLYAVYDSIYTEMDNIDIESPSLATWWNAYSTENIAPNNVYMRGTYANIIDEETNFGSLDDDNIVKETDYLQWIYNAVDNTNDCHYILLGGNTVGQWGDGFYGHLIDGIALNTKEKQVDPDTGEEKEVEVKATKWGGQADENGNTYIIFRTQDKTSPFFYTLTTGNDTQSYPNRNWGTWYIYGANFEGDGDATKDAEGWELIDKKENVGQDRLHPVNAQPSYFGFTEKQGEYMYYKVVVTKAYGGNAIQMNELYFGTPDEFEAIKDEYLTNANDFDPDDYRAEQALIDEYKATVPEIDGCANMEALFVVNYKLETLRAAIEASAALYDKLETQAEEIAEMAKDLSASDALDKLLGYITGDAAEPTDTYPHGNVAYILEEHILNDSIMQVELDFLEAMKVAAVAIGYGKGMDITCLIVNPTFAKAGDMLKNEKDENIGREAEGWSGYIYRTAAAGGEIYAAEFCNVNAKFDVNQTLANLKNGYYKVTLNAGYRANGNLSSLNYAPMVYANDVATYVPIIREDMATDATRWKGTYEDKPIYAIDVDEATGDASVDSVVVGYGIWGCEGAANAFAQGRYAITMVAKVTDGKLTIGVKNDGTKGNEWTGVGNFGLVYLGETENDATVAIREAAAYNANRITTLTETYMSGTDLYDDYSDAPGFSAAQKATLLENRSKLTYEAEKIIGETMKAIYETKKAYVVLFEASTKVWNKWSNYSSEPYDEAIYNVRDNLDEGTYVDAEAALAAKAQLYADYPDYLEMTGNGKVGDLVQEEFGFDIVTTGARAYLSLHNIYEPLEKDEVILAFEYTAEQDIVNGLFLYETPTLMTDVKDEIPTLPAVSDWTKVYYNVSAGIKGLQFGSAVDHGIRWYINYDASATDPLTLCARNFRLITKAQMKAEGGKTLNNEMGDLNGDEKIDIADAVTVLNIMASGEYVKAADLNGDGKVDIADFVTVLNIMAAQ